MNDRPFPLESELPYTGTWSSPEYDDFRGLGFLGEGENESFELVVEYMDDVGIPCIFGNPVGSSPLSTDSASKGNSSNVYRNKVRK